MNLPITPSQHPGYSILVLGPPGSGKSTFALGAAKAAGSAIIALAPGLDEEASYRTLRDQPEYIIRGYDDDEFYPDTKDGLKATGFNKLLSDLRTAYTLMATGPRPGALITDTFNSMCQLAMNKTYAKFGRVEPPPAMSPDGASFWGYYRTQQESLMRVCRAIRGLGPNWIATCHVAEKEQRDVGPANPTKGLAKIGLVPAIAGGFRDVFAAGFDMVFYAGVDEATTKGGKPNHYLQWEPDPKRPTKSRYGGLAETGKIANSWTGLVEKLQLVKEREDAGQTR